MKTSNEIVIRGSYERIFELAAKAEDWGEILPHYRYVKLLRSEGNRRWLRMSAWRNFIPVTWSAIESVYPGTAAQPGLITFSHIRGLVKGMYVEWSFEVRADKGDVLVKISHDLKKPPFPVRLLGKKLTEVIVGTGFIGYIADKTLRRVKELAEIRN